MDLTEETTKAYFSWAMDNGCVIYNHASGKRIGHSFDVPPRKVFFNFSDGKSFMRGIPRLVQYGARGLVYVNYKGCKCELYYNTFEETYFIGVYEA